MSARAWILSRIYRAGYQALRPYWLVARPRTRGVKCVIARGDEILLVRHTYGDRGRWDLPGGRMKRGEQPVDTARREIREELGVDLERWTAVGDLLAPLHNRRDMVCIFETRVEELVLELDRAEIDDARWFPRDRLPAKPGRHVSQILALTRRPS
jgi:8-oxo-dGTP pyrophosphatase MutT (NUDIX family)